MKLVVLTVGKGGFRWAGAAFAEYDKRLRRWGGLASEHVKVEKFRGNIDAVREAESARLLDTIGPRDVLVAMDERGEDLDTDGFVELVRERRLDGTRKLVFALGGAYGHAPVLRQRADRVVRLSSAVMNHDVARVVLAEQLYRVMTLCEGVPYHH